MKKYNNPYLFLNKYIPDGKQLHLRGEKDRQVFRWLIESPKGKATIRLTRKILGLPEDGIVPIETYAFTRLEDLPNFPSNSEVSWGKLNQYTLKLLQLLGLSSRFYDSVKSFLVFNRAIPAAPSVQPLVQGVPPKQELTILIYPDARFRDIRESWRVVVSSQKEFPKVKNPKNKWKIKIGVGKYPEEKLASVIIRTDTTLEDLNSKKFRNELDKIFNNSGTPRKPYRGWNLKLDSKLQEIDAKPNLSEEEKAKILFNKDDYDSIQKIRRIRHRNKRKLIST